MMKRDLQQAVARRSFLSRIGGGIAALGAWGAGSAVAAAETQAPAPAPAETGHWQPTRHAIDDWLDQLPGKHRLNLHAIYGDFRGQKVERNEITPAHFQGWIDWAKALGIGLDFNPTLFSHPKAADNFTLSHSDEAIRSFWIRHAAGCRRIGAAMGKALGTPCVTNLWIPDGMKDTPADRVGPRERLIRSLDAVFEEKLDPGFNLDSVEGKLFGLGCESFTVGSHEFYFGYALSRKILYTLDTGHYHPTETIADKISAVLMFIPEILLHVSRGVRWDSDHVVVLGDDLDAIAQELVRGDFLQRTHIGLDYFDASINRVAAWVIGTRNTLKALLKAMLEPTALLRECEARRDYTGRLALQEDIKSLPWGAVWDRYCETAGAPVGARWLHEVTEYERRVLSTRS